jgi:hypothetical protein
MIGEIATLVYTILTGLALLAGIIGVYVKISTQTTQNTNDIERMEISLKENTKKQELINKDLNRVLSENNKDLMSELKKYEEKISTMYELLQKVNITMEMIVSGKIQTK